MLDFIVEKENCWDYLKRTELPVFIYGMGDGALKIMRVFEQYNIPLAGFFASDEFVRGHSFEGHLVHTLSQIENIIDEFVVVLAFAAGYQSLYDRVNEIAKKHILLSPDVPVAGDGLFTYEYAVQNAKKIARVYNLLEDEQSRKTYADVINFKISGKIDYLNACTAPQSEVYDQLIKLSDDEVYVDLGAYNGDTALEFINACNGRYKSIYAFEPNPRNFRKMTKNIGERANFYPINAGAWSSTGTFSFTKGEGRMTMISEKGKTTAECCAVDDTVKEQATLIKLDVEGAENEAILGAERHIKGGAKIISALYHRNEDMFDIPLLIHELNPKLKMYIRHQLYIPAWETNLYCTMQ